MLHDKQILGIFISIFAGVHEFIFLLDRVASLLCEPAHHVGKASMLQGDVCLLELERSGFKGVAVMRRYSRTSWSNVVS